MPDRFDQRLGLYLDAPCYCKLTRPGTGRRVRLPSFGFAIKFIAGFPCKNSGIVPISNAIDGIAAVEYVGDDLLEAVIKER